MPAAVFMSMDPPTQVQEVVINGSEQNEVLVKVSACGVCHSDLRVMGWVPGPAIFGYKVAGVGEVVGLVGCGVTAGIGATRMVNSANEDAVAAVQWAGGRNRRPSLLCQTQPEYRPNNVHTSRTDVVDGVSCL